MYYTKQELYKVILIIKIVGVINHMGNPLLHIPHLRTYLETCLLTFDLQEKKVIAICLKQFSIILVEFA